MAGFYFSFHLPGLHNYQLRNLFSMSSTPTDSTLTLVGLKKIESCSRFHSSKPTEELVVC